jgi:hypothetical protein
MYGEGEGDELHWEVGIDEHLVTGGSTATEQGHQVPMLHLEQKPHLVQELTHALP